METVLVTGGAGFFGEILKNSLLERGYKVVSVDLHHDAARHPALVALQGDIRDPRLVDAVISEHKPSIIYHCAALLAHEVKDDAFLWASNVDGTRHVAESAARNGVRKIVFTSTNCLWGRSFGRPVREDDVPEPVEIYGRSKWEAEQVLWSFRDRVGVSIIRCPTIIEAGRLGLLAILFEFIDENRRVWVVGGGENRYQFIYALDLAAACMKAAVSPDSDIFNVGSANVKSFREVYEYVIRKAGSSSRVAALPKGPALIAMRLAHALGVSPLGPYQYRMIAEDFEFDTTKIRTKLGWAPTLTNEEMLYRSYEYYHKNRREIESRTDVSAHKKAAPLGAIRLLKWLS